MVRPLYPDIVMDVRGPGRNPSVTRPCFEGGDNAAEAHAGAILLQRALELLDARQLHAYIRALTNCVRGRQNR